MLETITTKFFFKISSLFATFNHDMNCGKVELDDEMKTFKNEKLLQISGKYSDVFSIKTTFPVCFYESILLAKNEFESVDYFIKYKN